MINSASTEQLRALRSETGAPVLECRKALDAAQGDLARARALLKERGYALAAQKAGRATGQGSVGVYVHGPDGRIAAMVLLRCETDFVARSPVFQSLAKDLAMHVAAMNPQAVRSEDTPAGSPLEETALLAQPFVKSGEGGLTVADLLAAKVLELGENIVVDRFARFAV